MITANLRQAERGLLLALRALPSDGTAAKLTRLALLAVQLEMLEAGRE